MSAETAITERIFWIGVNDRQTGLFEELWPIPEGIAYNSYMVLDDKVAIVDAVKAVSADQYLEKIKRLLGEKKKIDFLIINHIEPDHSGALKILLEAFPGMVIVGNKKTLELLEHFYGIAENVRLVEDAYGGFVALDDGIFDDEIADMGFYENEILRSFTNVIGKYSVMVQKALSRIRDLDISIVASTHGPVWRKRLC